MRNYILDNERIFKAQIELLIIMKDDFNTPLEKSIIDKVYKKIAEYSNYEIIVPKKVISNKKRNHYILAADSEDKETLLITETFKDSDEDYLAKVITTNDSNNIYILPKNPNVELEFTIKLYPSEDEFSGNNKDQPIIVTPKQRIEEIQIQVRAA